MLFEPKKAMCRAFPGLEVLGASLAHWETVEFLAHVFLLLNKGKTHFLPTAGALLGWKCWAIFHQANLTIG